MKCLVIKHYMSVIHSSFSYIPSVYPHTNFVRKIKVINMLLGNIKFRRTEDLYWVQICSKLQKWDSNSSVQAFHHISPNFRKFYTLSLLLNATGVN